MRNSLYFSKNKQKTNITDTGHRCRFNQRQVGSLLSVTNSLSSPFVALASSCLCWTVCSSQKSVESSVYASCDCDCCCFTSVVVLKIFQVRERSVSLYSRSFFLLFEYLWALQTAITFSSETVKYIQDAILTLSSACSSTYFKVYYITGSLFGFNYISACAIGSCLCLSST